MIFSTKFNVKIEYIAFFPRSCFDEFSKGEKDAIFSIKGNLLAKNLSFSPYDIDTLSFNFLSEYSFF